MRHPDVISPHFKEAQWFARGRFRKKHFSYFIEDIWFKTREAITQKGHNQKHSLRMATPEQENGESRLLPIPVLILLEEVGFFVPAC